MGLSNLPPTNTGQIEKRAFPSFNTLCDGRQNAVLQSLGSRGFTGAELSEDDCYISRLNPPVFYIELPINLMVD